MGRCSNSSTARARVQPGDSSRAWGVNSPARLPAFGAKVSKAMAEQLSYRMPQSVMTEKCAQSGACFVASDYDASLTAPCVQNVGVVPGNK